MKRVRFSEPVSRTVSEPVSRTDNPNSEGADGFENVSQLMSQMMMQMKEALTQQMHEYLLHHAHDLIQEQMYSTIVEDLKQVMQQRLKNVLRQYTQEASAQMQEEFNIHSQRTEERLQDILRNHENKYTKRIRTEVWALETKMKKRGDRLKGKVDKIEVDCIMSQLSDTSSTGICNSLTQLDGRMTKMEQAIQKTLQTVFPRVDALVSKLERRPHCAATRSVGPVHNLPSTSTGMSSSLLTQSIRPTKKPEPSFNSLLLPQDFPNRSEALARDLLQAVRWEKTDYVRKLLSAGAKTDFSGTDGWSCLIWAAQNANAEIIFLLLEKGADFSATNSEGHTPLHFASLNDYNGCSISLLIDAGADVNRRSRDGDTPLHFAAMCGNEVAARKLIEAGASKTVKNNAGKTPYNILSGLALFQLLQP